MHSKFFARRSQEPARVLTSLSVNKALQGKWASLACHETGSLVVQVSIQPLGAGVYIYIHLAKHAFENLEESAKDGIVDELLNRGETVFADVAKNQWGSYCIQHSEFVSHSLRIID